MYRDLIGLTATSIWFGITMLGIRRGVLFYKVMHGLPLDYEGTKKIGLATWGGITFYAALWPWRALKTLAINLWTFVPSMLLLIFYKVVVVNILGEDELSAEDKALYELLLAGQDKQNENS